MTLLNTHLDPEGIIPEYDGNTIKWSGYFSTSEQAEEHLKELTKKIAVTENKLVVSAKSEFINRHFKGYFLYRFVVILTNK
jgi:uncharacterized protein YfcZ (UPF0381/DUF406 family)